MSASTRPRFVFAGMAVRVLAGAAATGGELAVCAFEAPAGAATPLHRHTREDEIVVVHAGTLTVARHGADARTLGPGESVHLPREVPHRLAAGLGKDARFLLVWTPGGFEAALAAAGRMELLDAGRRSADPSPVMLAVLAQEAAYAGEPRAEVVRLAERATSAGFMEHVGPGTNTYNLLVHGLRYAEGAELAARLLDEGEALIRRLGERFAAFFLDHARAYWHYNFGSVATGSAHAGTGLTHVRALHLDVTVAAFAAIAAELLVEQDRLDEAAAIVDALDAPAVAETVSGAFALSARALVRTLQDRHADAEADARRAMGLLDQRGWRAPMVSRAPLRLARQLGRRGEVSAALELLEDAESVARRAGTTGALGATLRARGRVVGGDAALGILSDAVDALAASPLGLEHAWALHDLGGALRRAGRRADAREPLRQALEIADRKEALLLARRARDELAATGARPRRTALSGPASLTPSERRVAELAAAGMSNREIAESLWVTRKTVELHLGHAYGKLGIRARTQLAAALEAGAGAVAA